MSDVVLELGPLGVFLLMVPESACIPVPSEVTLMCAGFAVRSGLMPFWLAVLAATAGNLVGSLIAYGVGRAGSGREIGPRAGRAFAACNRPFAAPTREYPRRLDYVFVRGPDKRGRGQPISARVVMEEVVGGVCATDHYGVLAEISI